MLIIYPYWILKFTVAVDLSYFSPAYNLSILDFKCCSLLEQQHRIFLIIYPYWILNRFAFDCKTVLPSLIIYPYWILNVLGVLCSLFYCLLIIYPYWILNMKKRIIFAGSSMCICQPKIRSTAHWKLGHFRPSLAPAALLPQVQLLFYYCFEVSSVVPQSFTEPVGIAFYINQITVGRRTQDYIRQAALQPGNGWNLLIHSIIRI